MFDPTRDEARGAFLEAWRRYREGRPLVGVEAPIVEVILLHPEYHALLGDPESARGRDYEGQSNPFLHLSLHLALAEQLSIGQPPGIAGRLAALEAKTGDRHRALHEAIECLAETIWRSQKDRTPPDAGSYLDCLARRAR